MKQTEGREECGAFRAQQALVFDMLDYAHQTADLYKSITNVNNLKHAATPFVADGSVSIEDEEAKGELAPKFELVVAVVGFPHHGPKVSDQF